MHLSPHEQERLARRRQARGLKLNIPEATAPITDHVPEGARDAVLVVGLHGVARSAEALVPAGPRRVPA